MRIEYFSHFANITNLRMIYYFFMSPSGQSKGLLIKALFLSLSLFLSRFALINWNTWGNYWRLQWENGKWEMGNGKKGLATYLAYRCRRCLAYCDGWAQLDWAHSQWCPKHRWWVASTRSSIPAAIQCADPPHHAAEGRRECGRTIGKCERMPKERRAKPIKSNNNSKQKWHSS